MDHAHIYMQHMHVTFEHQLNELCFCCFYQLKGQEGHRVAVALWFLFIESLSADSHSNIKKLGAVRSDYLITFAMFPDQNVRERTTCTNFVYAAI